MAVTGNALTLYGLPHTLDLNSTTSCKHSLVLLRMDKIITRNMLSWSKLLIKLLLLHLVGYLYYCINDAWSHKCQIKSQICIFKSSGVSTLDLSTLISANLSPRVLSATTVQTGGWEVTLLYGIIIVSCSVCRPFIPNMCQGRSFLYAITTGCRSQICINDISKHTCN